MENGRLGLLVISNVRLCPDDTENLVYSVGAHPGSKICNDSLVLLKFQSDLWHLGTLLQCRFCVPGSEFCISCLNSAAWSMVHASRLNMPRCKEHFNSFLPFLVGPLFLLPKYLVRSTKCLCWGWGFRDAWSSCPLDFCKLGLGAFGESKDATPSVNAIWRHS